MFRIIRLAALAGYVIISNGCSTIHRPTVVKKLLVEQVPVASVSAVRHPTPQLTTLAPSPINRYTIAEDKERGTEMIGSQAEEPFTPSLLVADATLTDYLAQLIDELVAYTPEYAKVFTYRPHLYRGLRNVNAYAAPGGHVYVSLEIIAGASSEDMLAGVLAHEIGHIALRHSTALATHEMFCIWETLIGKDNPTDEFMRGVTPEDQKLFKLFRANESRRAMSGQELRRMHEIEADIFAVQVLSSSRFDPIEYRNWHQLLAHTQDRPNLPHHGTHPLHATRATRISVELSTHQSRPHRQTTSWTFAQARGRARALAAREINPELTILPAPTLIPRAPLESHK